MMKTDTSQYHEQIQSDYLILQRYFAKAVGLLEPSNAFTTGLSRSLLKLAQQLHASDDSDDEAGDMRTRLDDYFDQRVVLLVQVTSDLKDVERALTDSDFAFRRAIGDDRHLRGGSLCNPTDDPLDADGED